LYLQNWTFLLKEPTPLVVIHLWSLAVEEQFYLVWPVLVYFLSPRTLLGVAIMGCLVALALRLRLVSCAVSPEAVYRSTFCRMDALMLGAGCAVGFRIGSVARLITGLGRAPLFIGVAGLGAVRLTMTAYDSKPMQEFGYTIVAFCYATLLSYTVATVGQGHMVERLITSKPLAFLGKYSYGMYLYHVPVYRGLHFVEGMLVPARKHFGLANVFAAFTLTILLSYISYHLFELPFLNLKRRFRPRFGPGRDPAADGAASTALTRSQT
jgi:peptidoglycan/LPS O-acetylase OafA/YrhL